MGGGGGGDLPRQRVREVVHPPPDASDISVSDVSRTDSMDDPGNDSMLIMKRRRRGGGGEEEEGAAKCRGRADKDREENQTR